ncbi:MAG TPA: alkaline phosphatase family protein [Puia sp.]|nr:alkaline phosphatase family protein [Puia sp.]
MKNIVTLVTMALLVLHAAGQPKKKKVIFIIADGIPADVLEKAKVSFPRQIGREEGYKHAFVGGERGGYSQTPTISAVGYNSLLTGTWVNKHNVRDNDIKEPNYHYPTIFQLVKKADSTKKIAVFSTWLDNRTRLVGESLPETGNIKVDYHVDGLELDTVNYPHDKQSLYIHNIDEKVTDEAEKCIREQGPDLTWLYLEYTDDMGHRYGDGPEQKEAVKYVDKQVGRIWNALQYRQQQFKEDWLIVITTDHGRDSISGKDHGGQSERERTTWIVTNAKDLNRYWSDYTPAIVDIMPTIARFMDINIPRDYQLEIDGLPLIGKLSVANPTIKVENSRLDIHWKAFDKDGTVKIWLSTTNNFKTGGKDEYKLLAEVPASQQSAVFGISSYPSSFYKIVLEGAYNTVNRWIVLK